MNWDALAGIEQVKVAFGEGGVIAISICLALIMLGVAIDIRLEDFKGVFRQPKAIITGLISQWLLLPALSLGLVFLLQPPHSIALGMLLVAVCPGGNVSNFYTALAKGNTALSVTLTSFSTLLTSVLTPLIFVALVGFAGLKGEVEVSISFVEMLKTLLLIVIIPLMIGMAIRYYHDAFANRISKIMKVLSFVLLAAIIAGAFSGNAGVFLQYLGPILLIVVIHNTLAFTGAYAFARLLKNKTADCKSVCIETGIQNSGLGLVLIFLFFEGNGGMACVAAFWGFWHLVGGFITAQILKRKLAS